jgi:hypothetical protein
MRVFPLVPLLAATLSAQPWLEHGPLRAAVSGHHLEHRDGAPFLWLGDTAWGLFYKLNREEVRAYLDDRRRKGFTVIQAVAYWYPHGEDGPGPHNAPNAYGHRPFEGAEDQPDTARPLLVKGGSREEPNDYWDHADFIVREVRTRGLYLALLPCWGRAYVNAAMPKSRATIDEQSARAFGRFLGRRYAKEPHIVWVIGGDINPVKGAGDRRHIYRAMAEAIGQAATGAPLRWDQPHPAWDRVLMTYHPEGDPANPSSRFFHTDAWLDVNGIETWKNLDQVHAAVAHDYALSSPVKPTLFLEGAYEGGRYPDPGGPIDGLKVRRQAWQAMLSGAAGHTYGAHTLWDFKKRAAGGLSANAWTRALEFPAAAQVAGLMGAFLRQHRWPLLKPAQDLLAEGAGAGPEQKAAARSDTEAVVYFPDASPATLRLPQAPASGQWFNPTDASTRPADMGGAPRFFPPAGWPDAVLVLRSR